jgi:hypothetical protein
MFFLSIMAKADQKSIICLPILQDGVMVTTERAWRQKQSIDLCFKAYKRLKMQMIITPSFRTETIP